MAKAIKHLLISVKLISEILNARYDNDFPRIILYSLPTPFYPNKPIKSEAMKQALKEGIDMMNGCKVSVIAIPCNTMHQFFDDMINWAEAPIINMIDETLTEVPPKSNKVALIATLSTAQSQIYQNRQKKILWNEKLQHYVDELLLVLKEDNFSKKAEHLWNQLLQYLIVDGYDTAIIACTDIGPCLLLPRSQEYPITILDSSDILARKTIEYYERLVNKLIINQK